MQYPGAHVEPIRRHVDSPSDFFGRSSYSHSRRRAKRVAAQRPPRCGGQAAAPKAEMMPPVYSYPVSVSGEGQVERRSTGCPGLRLGRSPRAVRDPRSQRTVRHFGGTTSPKRVPLREGTSAWGYQHIVANHGTWTNFKRPNQGYSSAMP